MVPRTPTPETLSWVVSSSIDGAVPQRSSIIQWVSYKGAEQMGLTVAGQPTGRLVHPCTFGDGGQSQY